MTWRGVWALVALGLGIVAARLVGRYRYGPLLLRVGEGPSATRPLLAAAIAAFYVVMPWVAPRAPWFGVVDSIVYLAVLVAVFLAPPPPGSWSVFEKGILCAEGPRAEFLRWEELERFEWNGNIALLHCRSALGGGGNRCHSLEVPSDRRAGLEGLLATRLSADR